MLRTFIQMSAMMLTFEAAFFLLKSNLGLSAKTIAELGTPRFDCHEETLISLSKQSVDTKVGLFLLLLSFTLQMANALWPLKIDEFDIDTCGAIASIIFCVVIFGASLLYTHHKSKRLFDKSMEIIQNRHRKKDRSPD
jgi:hypothetical protein